MSSLSQYINLYDNERGLIEAHAPAFMNRWRADARAVLEGAMLPTEHTEGYETTSIEKMMEPDLGVNINRLNFRADVAQAFKCEIPNMSTLLGIVVNDMFHPTNTLLSNLPEGVIFDSFSNVAAKDASLLEKFYGSGAPLDNPAVALNTMMAQDGLLLYIPAGVEMRRPVQLVNLFNSPTPLAAFRRLLIVVGENASGQLLVCDHTQGTNSYVGSVVTEIRLEKGARFDYYDMEKSSADTARHSMVFVNQAEGSNFMLNTTTLTCGTTRNEFTVNIDGEHCESRLTGMAIATGNQHIDNSSTVNHRAPHCHSDQLFKYVLEDDARGAFEGTILVTPEAPFTQAYQNNRNIVASQRAKMHTKPQLEIYHDEVKCSHGAATGQLDSEALFYMRTRGIPENEARNMLMQAFMVDVIDTVRLPALRDRLRHLVDMRFAMTENSQCGTCNNN